jgi:predicted RNA-binding Zn-ribbon protein involved in translation (DUF1610 family)
MAAPLDAWSSEWAELRRRNRRRWSQFFGLAALLLAAHALGLPEFAALLLAGPLLCWIVVTNWRTGDFRCPRCGKSFFRKRLWGFFSREDSSRGDCVYCGLEKFTPSYKV